MLNADDVELRAVRAAFCMVVARWRLGQAEVASLLGLGEGAGIADRVLPDLLDVRGETRLRLLVRADAELARLMPDDGELADWLRAEAKAYDGQSPLDAFADLANLRAVVRVLEGNAS